MLKRGVSINYDEFLRQCEHFNFVKKFRRKFNHFGSNSIGIT